MRKYTVVENDTLSKLSSRFYGEPSKWPVIYNANQSTLKSDTPDIIYPGEVLVIPDLPEDVLRRNKQKKKIKFNSNNSVTIIIDGKVFEKFTSFRLLTTMDTAADYFSANLPVDLDDNETWDLFNPDRFAETKVYINGELKLTGNVYITSPQISESGRIMSFIGFSKTIAIVDSTLRPPYEYNNVTLEDLSRTLLEPFSITSQFLDLSGGQFERVTADQNSSVYEYLAPLAKQRGLLISNNELGELLYLKADTMSEIVGTIEEDFPPGMEFKSTFDGRKRYREFKATSQDPENNSIYAISKDLNTPIQRFKTFSAGDSNDGNIQAAADWERSKSLANSLSIPFPVKGWISPNGLLWKENTKVVVKSKTIYAPNGFAFLIRSVEFKKESTGVYAILNLVPPSVFTGETIIAPWS